MTSFLAPINPSGSIESRLSDSTSPPPHPNVNTVTISLSQTTTTTLTTAYNSQYDSFDVRNPHHSIYHSTAPPISSTPVLPEISMPPVPRRVSSMAQKTNVKKPIVASSSLVAHASNPSPSPRSGDDGTRPTRQPSSYGLDGKPRGPGFRPDPTTTRHAKPPAAPCFIETYNPLSRTPEPPRKGIPFLNNNGDDGGGMHDSLLDSRMRQGSWSLVGPGPSPHAAAVSPDSNTDRFSAPATLIAIAPPSTSTTTTQPTLSEAAAALDPGTVAPARGRRRSGLGATLAATALGSQRSVSPRRTDSISSINRVRTPKNKRKHLGRSRHAQSAPAVPNSYRNSSGGSVRGVRVGSATAARATVAGVMKHPSVVSITPLLKQAITLVAELQPADAIAYLAHFLKATADRRDAENKKREQLLAEDVQAALEAARVLAEIEGAKKKRIKEAAARVRRNRLRKAADFIIDYNRWPTEVSMRLVRGYGIIHKMTHAFKLLRAQHMVRRIAAAMSVVDLDLKDGSLWGLMASKNTPTGVTRLNVLNTDWNSNVSVTVSIKTSSSSTSADFVKNTGRGPNTAGMPPSHRVLRAFMIMIGYSDEVANTITNSSNGLDVKNIESIMYTPGFFEALQIYWVPGEVNRTRMMAAFHAIDGLNWKVEIANPICNSAHGALAIKCLAYMKMAAESMGCDTRKVYMRNGELASLPREANTFFGVELQHAATVAPFPFIRTKGLKNDQDTGGPGTIKVVVRWGQEFGDENEVDANLIAIGADGQCLDVAYHFKPELYCGSARILIDEEAADLAESGEMCRAAVAFDIDEAASEEEDADDDDIDDNDLDASDASEPENRATAAAAAAAADLAVAPGEDNNVHHVSKGNGIKDPYVKDGTRRSTAELSLDEKSRPDRFMTYPAIRSPTMTAPENTPPEPTSTPGSLSNRVPHVSIEVNGVGAGAKQAVLPTSSTKDDEEEGGETAADEEEGNLKELPKERRVSRGSAYHLTLLKSSVKTSKLEDESVEGRSALRQLARVAATKRPALPEHKRWPRNSAAPYMRHDRYDRSQLDEFPGSRNSCEHHIHTWDHDYIACDIHNGEWAVRPNSGTIANRLSRYTRISEMHNLKVAVSKRDDGSVVLTPSATEESGSDYDTGAGESSEVDNHQHLGGPESDGDSGFKPINHETLPELEKSFREGVVELRAKVASSKSVGGGNIVKSHDDTGRKDTEESIDFPTEKKMQPLRQETEDQPETEDQSFPTTNNDAYDECGDEDHPDGGKHENYDEDKVSKATGEHLGTKDYDYDEATGEYEHEDGVKHVHGPTKRDLKKKLRHTAHQEQRLSTIAHAAHATKKRNSHLSILTERGNEDDDTDDTYDGDHDHNNDARDSSKTFPNADDVDSDSDDGFGKPCKPTIVWHAEGFHISLDAHAAVGNFKSEDIVAYAIIINAPVENESLMRVQRARVEVFREDHHTDHNGNRPTELLFDMPMDMTLANGSECVAALIHKVPDPEAGRSNTEKVGFEKGRRMHRIKYQDNAWAVTAVGDFVDRSERRDFDPQYFTLAMETCNNHLMALKVIPPPDLRDPTAGVRKESKSVVDKTLGVKDAVTRSSLMGWLEDKGTEGSAKLKRATGIGAGTSVGPLVGNTTNDTDEMMLNGFFNPFEMDVGDSLPLIWEYSDCNLRVGVGWDAKGGGAVDMDLIVLAYAGEDYFDQVDFGKLDLNGGGLTHLGDNRSGEGDGDDESVVINLDHLDDSITHLFLFVTIHGSDTFAAIEEISIRICITTESDNHDVEKEKEVCRFSSAELKHLPDSHRSALIGRVLLQETPNNESQWHFHAVQGSTQGTGNNVFALMTESHLVAACEKAKNLWRTRVMSHHKEKIRSKLQGAFANARRVSQTSAMFLDKFSNERKDHLQIEEPEVARAKTRKARRSSGATAAFLQGWTSEKEKLDHEFEEKEALGAGAGAGAGAGDDDDDDDDDDMPTIPRQRAMSRSWDQYSSIDASKGFREKRLAAGLSSPDV